MTNWRRARRRLVMNLRVRKVMGAEESAWVKRCLSVDAARLERKLADHLEELKGRYYGRKNEKIRRRRARATWIAVEAGAEDGKRKYASRVELSRCDARDARHPPAAAPLLNHHVILVQPFRILCGLCRYPGYKIYARPEPDPFARPRLLMTLPYFLRRPRPPQDPGSPPMPPIRIPRISLAASPPSMHLPQVV